MQLYHLLEETRPASGKKADGSSLITRFMAGVLFFTNATLVRVRLTPPL